MLGFAPIAGAPIGDNGASGKQIIFTVNAGSFSCTAQDVRLSVSIPSGSYTLTGQDAGQTRVHGFEAGSFSLSLSDIGFGRGFISVPASFTLTGQDINEGISDVFPSGAFSLTGSDVSFKRAMIRSAASGTFSLQGYDIRVLGFISPSLPLKTYAEQTVPPKTWVEPTEPTDTWAGQTGASSPTFTEASDVSSNTWTDAA